MRSFFYEKMYLKLSMIFHVFFFFSTRKRAGHTETRSPRVLLMFMNQSSHAMRGKESCGRFC